MTGSETLQGCWRPEQLHAAEMAYAEIVRRLDVAQQIERKAIADVLLKMTSEGCLDIQLLVQQCIACLYPLDVTAEIPGIAAVTMKNAAQFAEK